MIPDHVCTLTDVAAAERVGVAVEASAVFEVNVLTSVGSKLVANARASKVLERPRRIGRATPRRLHGVHSEDVELLVVEVVEIGVGGLLGDLSRDAGVHKGVKGLLLRDHSRRIGNEISVLHEGTHHGASDASPVPIQLRRG